MAATGLGFLRAATATAWTSTEKAYLTPLLPVTGRGTVTEKWWASGWLHCDYSSKAPLLSSLRKEQQRCHGNFNLDGLLAARIFDDSILHITAEQVAVRQHFCGLVAGDATIGDTLEIQRVAQHHVRFRSKRVSWPLPPREAESFRKLCDAVVYNYPAVLLPHNGLDELQPRPPSQTMWRLRNTDGVYLLVCEPVSGEQVDLGVVQTGAMAAATARRHDPTVRRFDSHPWLDGFAAIWCTDGKGAKVPQRQSLRQLRGASEVAGRARQASAASPRIGKALARVTWAAVARLKASSSSQRLLLHKIKGLRLSGWDRVHSRRGCPHCPLKPQGIDTGHTHHTVWHCRAAQTLWANFRDDWRRLGLTPAVADPEWCTAIFSLRLPQTPPLVWSLLGADSVPHELVGRVYDLLSILWQQQVLGCIQTIWRWRNGVADDDPPWTQPTAEAALRTSARAAFHQVQSMLSRTDPLEWTLRGLLLHLEQIQLAPVTLATTSPRHSMDQFLLFFDGGSRGNPSPGGAGAVIVRVGAYGNRPTITWAAAMSLAHSATTSNQAEYVGLLTGLRHAVDKRLQPLTVIGDSLMIINQLRAHRAPGHALLRALYGRARILTDTLGVTKWRHHVRAFNKMADGAANLAMNTKRSMQSALPCNRSVWADLAMYLQEDVAEWQASTLQDDTSLG